MEKQQSNPEMGMRPGGGPPMGGAKAKNFKGSVGKLAKFMKKSMPFIILAIVFAIGGTVLNILGPQYLGDIADLIQAGLNPLAVMDFDQIVSIGIKLIIMYSVGAVLLLSQGLIMTTIAQRTTKRMRTELSKKTARIPLNHFDTTSTGDILSRLTNDVDTVGQSLSMSLSSLLTAIVMILGVTIMMFAVNVIMALTAVGSALIGFIILLGVMKRTGKHFKAMQDGLGEVSGKAEEVYSSINVIKSYNAKKAVRADFDKSNTKIQKSAQKANFVMSAMPSVMSCISNFAYVAVCIVGSVLVINGSINIGIIVSFMIYIRIFTQPLNSIAQAGQSVQSVAASSERVFEYLELDEQKNEDHKTAKLENIKGDITFKNVKFGYSPEKIIINDFSADIKAGSKVAIVGPTGAGKTTLVNLLMRFYEINAGQIMIDGVDIATLKREDIHRMFSMVLQDTWMFDGTIKENIVYSKQGVTDEELVKAIKDANLDHLIQTLPDGYNTVMDDKASLSAGQKQLITIARSIVDNAPMLILDEATSSVDTRTEVLIQKAMDNLSKDRTTFVIAHRLSTIKNADIILVLKDGDIIEKGSHDELMKLNGFYSDLYNSQFSK